ncbi:hypothetical protein QIU18_07885 [Capnocytophaga canimorsus]|nr:hypothetical protein [Capnocytophaga canimorsus]WGU69260.1 hypothetical protein QIU19_05840 [Capnocytophaga canimorsus]WGU69622.1 hypothetical protein QIU18_07885 [Capnocytophaga canimorsus]
MKSKKIELGITSFGETTPLEATGKAISHAERIQNMVEEMELADAVGLDIYAIGEHHRSDFAVSVPEMVLASRSGEYEKHSSVKCCNGAFLFRPNSYLSKFCHPRCYFQRKSRNNGRERVFY